jgi:tetratricopeptide (TPR) repeat protein
MLCRSRLARARRSSGWQWFLPILGWLVCPWLVPGAELSEARKQFISGQYAECIKTCEQAIADAEYEEEWRLLLAQSQMTLGRYPAALTTVSNALNRYSSSVRARLLGHEVYRQNGQPERALELLHEIADLVNSRSWAYNDPLNLVAIGQAALLLGNDPRLVLNQMFDRAKRQNPSLRETYLASGELALDKNDFQLAAKTFQEGLKRFEDDPDLLYGLARALEGGERPDMLKALASALMENTNHLPSLLLLVDHQIDAEDYGGADKLLEKVFTVNPWHPEAWAYRAVIEHLRGKPSAEAEARGKGLRFWAKNPEVDHLIGRKLSQKYRFTEGAAAQRQALKFDVDFLPARNQLAQDLLRLGDEEEGWRMVDEVHQHDGYDVVAYNLVTLHDSVSKFRALTNEHFIVRMSAREAPIYGAEVLGLLERARTALCEKYEMELSQPTIVEIFPEQKDFAVRTFGLPGGAGYLGVCFGRVITANSPASQAAHPKNWQSVLWHEFCHVVTLQKTRNKMPRWLSEGISVYEERQANPAWGEALIPQYREMILGDDFVPVGKLSAAFLTPKTSLHLQFAYYESSLVVEFLVKQFGLDSVKNVLRDLGEGVLINDAIEHRTASLEKIEKDFSAFARQRAEQLAPGLDFKKPKRGAAIAAVEDDDPDAKPKQNFYKLASEAKKLIAQKKFQEAKAPSQKLLDLFPGYTDADNAYELLAAAHRGLKETDEEREILSRFATLNADATDAYQRLMELAAAAQDWKSVLTNAARFLAVNPLLVQPHRYLARASEELGQAQQAIQSYQLVLALDPPDPPEVHFRLARLLRPADEPAAKRHVLQALEDAPRFRDAHLLLLELTKPPEK